MNPAPRTRLLARLDTLLGRISLYRLVIYVLLALAALGTVLAGAGRLDFTVAAVLASLAVLLLSCWLSGLLFGLIFRTAPHHESGVITALLLFLLFWPSTDPGTLLSLAYAGVVATASKYLLAIRGRHVFNPAAAAALVVAFSSEYLPFMAFNAATWWVGTPAMLPLTALGAVLILYRSRKLPLGAVFVCLAVIFITFRLSAAGTALPAALWQSLGSYPAVFIAGFMLSEPLTLPPRRAQQLVLAAVVATVAFVPFHAGPFYNSPELALLIGNVLAFLAGQRGGILLRFAGARQLTPTSREISFIPARPIRFNPGQYLELSLPHAGTDSRGRRRIFSLTGAPSEPGRITFGLRISEPSSSFKRSLLTLTDGDTVRGTQVGGDFLLPTDPAVPLLLAAGGIGITPFMSQLRWLRDTGQSSRHRRLWRLTRHREAAPRDVVLLYLVSSPEEIAYADELDHLGVKVLLLCPGGPELPQGWVHLGGLPSDERELGKLLRSAVPDLPRRTAYVSGSPRNVSLLRGAILAAGGKRPKTDAFFGY